MTPKLTLRYLTARVKKWRTILHLQDWSIEVELKELERETEGIAHCEASHEYRHAVLRFDPRHVTRDNCDGLIAHELLHCHVWGLAHAAGSLCRKDSDKEWVRVEEEKLVTALERLVMSRIDAPE